MNWEEFEIWLKENNLFFENKFYYNEHIIDEYGNRIGVTADRLEDNDSGEIEEVMEQVLNYLKNKH